jgi:hypothetical protein
MSKEVVLPILWNQFWIDAIKSIKKRLIPFFQYKWFLSCVVSCVACNPKNIFIFTEYFTDVDQQTEMITFGSLLTTFEPGTITKIG